MSKKTIKKRRGGVLSYLKKTLGNNSKEFSLLTNESELHVSGMSGQGTINLKPIDLLLVFGRPLVGDGDKVSGEYLFKHHTSETIISLYDWKQTNLYHKSININPSQFWSQDKNIEFSIGAHNSQYTSNFISWIKKEIKQKLNKFNKGLRH